MGGALLKGWLRMGVAPSSISVVERDPSAELAALVDRHGLTLTPALSEIGSAEVVVLAVKPQSLCDIAGALNSLLGPETLLVSILAGKTTSDLSNALPSGRGFVRVMPNLPAAIGKGISVAFANAGLTTEQKRITELVLSGVGGVEWLADEGLMDAVTALSGSGPAYVFLLVEAMTAAGVAAGLPAEMASRLAHRTVAGTGEMLGLVPEEAGRLRAAVTSPNGTTAAAMEILTGQDAFAKLVTQAVMAAKCRSQELSG